MFVLATLRSDLTRPLGAVVEIIIIGEARP